ncbi:hypothetical protein RJ640_020118 [Escallonia rubra]|uniref:Uncharacterized protein n=1 Tax=Escallonia rubra TaxID=112253 RepID=A0AA88RCP4_9ASTE|nr:hypothetical protein RJ640_020118 [Escallonia rubra]
MTATATKIHGVSTESIYVKPPAHPTYDLKVVIKLALAEDVGNRVVMAFRSKALVLHIIKMTATTTKIHGVSTESISVKPPPHPTYDLKTVIKLALAEDAGNRGIALAEMVFNVVDPALKVEWSKQDGDSVHKGLQFGKVHGKLKKRLGFLVANFFIFGIIELQFIWPVGLLAVE